MYTLRVMLLLVLYAISSIRTVFAVGDKKFFPHKSTLTQLSRIVPTLDGFVRSGVKGFYVGGAFSLITNGLDISSLSTVGFYAAFLTGIPSAVRTFRAAESSRRLLLLEQDLSNILNIYKRKRLLPEDIVSSDIKRLEKTLIELKVESEILRHNSENHYTKSFLNACDKIGDTINKTLSEPKYQKYQKDN